MLKCVTNGVEKAGIPLPEALRMASLYPATVLGEQARRGIIEPGAHADLILLDEQLTLQQVIVDGEA
jgi:N-acetylglucosamine-6-phosphate deacetylase